MKTMALALAALLLALPLVDAITIVTVDSQRYEHNEYVAPFSDTYSMSFAGTLFDPVTKPVFLGTSAYAAHFGEVTVNHLVHWETDWTIQDNAGTSVNVSIAGVGGKTWYGHSSRGWDVRVNGSLMWKLDDQTVGELWSTFNYEDSHVLQYGENMTVLVPTGEDGTVHWDASVPFGGPWNTDTHWGHRTTSEPRAGGALYLIQPDLAADAFGLDNNSYSKFWLANLTGPIAWTTVTTYTDRTPETLSVDRQFITQGTFVSLDRPIACSWPTIERYVGFCPSLSSLAGYAVSLVPNMFGSLIGLVNPQWGEFFKTAGDWAGEFVSAIVFTQVLLVSSPGKLMVVTFFTVSGFANLIGGLRGDLGDVIYLNMMFFKYTAIAVFWYFYLYWLILKWSFDKVLAGLQMLAQWTTALNPEILGFKL